MKFNNIAAFGDSWVWGDELIDPSQPDLVPHSVENTQYRESHCFPGILGQYFNLPVENFAIPGGSLQSTVWNYLWWLNNRTDHGQTLVLVGLTDPSRVSWYNPDHVVYENDADWNRYVHSAWAHNTNCYSGDWQQYAKYHVALSDSPELRKYNYQQALLFFHGQSHQQPLIQFNILQPQPDLAVRSLLCPDSSLRELLAMYSNCWAPQRHPNEHGHQIIADILISHIESAIITRC